MVMDINRVQFQPGLSLPAFLCQYGTPSACEQALLTARWPQGLVLRARHHVYFARAGRRYWQCRACRHHCSRLSDTVFDNTKLPLTTWFPQQ